MNYSKYREGGQGEGRSNFSSSKFNKHIFNIYLYLHIYLYFKHMNEIK